ncbi:hypothetical protein HUJ05_005654 [Dendroctonus ponderosae]|nr:hypothetical protein HUJ05_005654 [Dendroctonus ponderosae]
MDGGGSWFTSGHAPNVRWLMVGRQSTPGLFGCLAGWAGRWADGCPQAGNLLQIGNIVHFEKSKKKEFFQLPSSSAVDLVSFWISVGEGPSRHHCLRVFWVVGFLQRALFLRLDAIGCFKAENLAKNPNSSLRWAQYSPPFLANCQLIVEIDGDFMQNRVGARSTIDGWDVKYQKSTQKSEVSLFTTRLDEQGKNHTKSGIGCFMGIIFYIPRSIEGFTKQEILSHSLIQRSAPDPVMQTRSAPDIATPNLEDYNEIDIINSSLSSLKPDL